jgi:PIN domain nuclease of toxin-antitoxin system
MEQTHLGHFVQGSSFQLLPVVLAVVHLHKIALGVLHTDPLEVLHKDPFDVLQVNYSKNLTFFLHNKDLQFLTIQSIDHILLANHLEYLLSLDH